MNRVFNFSPGPAALPLPVLQTIQEELLDYKNTGMSIMEMSHRGPEFLEVYYDSIARLKKLAEIPERFDVLYMSGGASLQFALIPMNLISGSARDAGYVNTGIWSQKAIDQALLQGVPVHNSGSSKESGYDRIPESFDIPAHLEYLHITSNNTIYGTQFHKNPDTGGVPLIIDMSSDFLSRPIDWNNVGLIYAGAQKNAGPSGLTVAIIDRDLYSRESEKTPTLLRYSTFGKNESSYNTPPTFQIYVFRLVLEWIESMGGLHSMDVRNQEKAALIYNTLEAHPEVYKICAQKGSRSLMNITFNLINKDDEGIFLEESRKRRLLGLKGHRIFGGFRASVYNAMTIEGCRELAGFLTEFAAGNRGKK